MQALRQQFWLLMVAGLLSLGACSAQAQESALTGRWAVKILVSGFEISVWLIDVEQKGNQLQAKLLDTLDQFKGSAIKSAAITGDELHLTLELQGTTFAVTASPAQKGKEPQHLFGTLAVEGSRDLVRLDRTEEKKFNPRTVQQPGPAAQAYKAALKTADAKEKASQLQNVIKKYPDEAITIKAATGALALLAGSAGSDELNALAKHAVELAGRFGPEARLAALAGVTEGLLQAKDKGRLALTYAQQLRKALGKDTPPELRLPAWQTIAEALQQAGQVEEAKEARAMVEKLYIPFPVEKVTDGTDKHQRPVVVELFTGAECPPCVAADVAFDALLKAFPPGAALFLQYHLHIPRPDPLSNPESESRSQYYLGEEAFTPALFINGEKGPSVGGPRVHAEQTYKLLRSRIEKERKQPAQGQLDLTVKRAGDTLTLTAQVSGLKKTGKAVRLRFVLFEDAVRYPGGNQQRLHHHVVRGFPGGEQGVAMQQASGTYTQTVKLNEVRKELRTYLDNFHQRMPFPSQLRPLDLTHLGVAVLLQDNESKAILNAAQVEVPAAE